MKKLILIITLCTFTSLTAATPIAAAQVTPCPNNTTKNVTISSIGNINANQDINELLSKVTGKTINTAELAKIAGTNSNVKVIKVNKNCNTKKAKKAKKVKTKKAVAAKKNTTKKPVTTTKSTTTITAKSNTTANTTANTTKTNATKTNTTTNTTSKTSTAANTSTSTAAASSFSQYQKKVVELVNKERAAAGLSPLKEVAALDNVATLKSQDMVNKNYFSHTSPTYGSPFEMLKQFGISYTAAGENIAYGQSSPEEVMNGWMNSPGHRANILNANFTQIGVGIAKKANGQLYWTQTFTRP